MRAIAYLRVSTDEQARSGLGLEAQRDTVAGEIGRRGWDYQEIIDDGYSAKNLRRPGIDGALETLKSGDADVLVVAKLDRLSRSVIDFAGLLQRARREDWGIVALDLAVDTSTPSGKMMANVVMAFAEYERELIGERTRIALAVKKASGFRLGEPPKLPAKVRARIGEEREAGATLQVIADGLNEGSGALREGRRPVVSVYGAGRALQPRGRSGNGRNTRSMRT